MDELRIRGLRSAGTRYAPEIVLQALDVVFSEISPALNFDEDEHLGSGIFDAMRDSGWNVNCRTRLQHRIVTVDGYSGGPRRQPSSVRIDAYASGN